MADIDAFIGFSRDLGIDKVCEILTVLFFPGGGSDQPQSDLPLVALSQFDYYHWLRLLEFFIWLLFFPLFVSLLKKRGRGFVTPILITFEPKIVN